VVERLDKSKKKTGKSRFRLGDREKQILLMIGGGSLVIGSLVIPALPLMLKPLFDERPSQFKIFLDKLKKKRLITLGGEEIRLSNKGLKLVQEIKVRDIEISKPDKWDGIWHLVSYDIPVFENHNRDLFRATLKRWGFYQIQKSLWVFPYSCKEEIAVLADYLLISDYVITMNTDNLPNEEKMEDFFNLP